MYELLSFVYRGKTRRVVLEHLLDPHTPTELSIIIGTQRSTISRTILALEKKGLVKCITPNESMGRYYEITDLGKNILDKLRKTRGESE